MIILARFINDCSDWTEIKNVYNHIEERYTSDRNKNVVKSATTS